MKLVQSPVTLVVGKASSKEELAKLGIENYKTPDDKLDIPCLVPKDYMLPEGAKLETYNDLLKFAEKDEVPNTQYLETYVDNLVVDKGGEILVGMVNRMSSRMAVTLVTVKDGKKVKKVLEEDATPVSSDSLKKFEELNNSAWILNKKRFPKPVTEEQAGLEILRMGMDIKTLQNAFTHTHNKNNKLGRLEKTLAGMNPDAPAYKGLKEEADYLKNDLKDINKLFNLGNKLNVVGRPNKFTKAAKKESYEF